MEKPVACPLGSNGSNGARIYPLTLERVYKVVQLAIVIGTAVWTIATLSNVTENLARQQLVIVAELTSVKLDVKANTTEVARMRAFEEGRRAAIAAATLAKQILKQELKDARK